MIEMIGTTFSTLELTMYGTLLLGIAVIIVGTFLLLGDEE